jgi:hypothetical protein
MAGANWIQWARDLAKLGLCDPKKAVAITKRRDELFTATLSAGGLDKLQSSSKNGISYTVQTGNNQSFSVSDEFAALNKAVEWIEQGSVPSQTRSINRF